MNPSFNIQSPRIYTEAAKLVIEAGPTGISFTILNTGNCFQAVVIYSFPNKLTEAEINEELQEILKAEPLLKNQYREKQLIWNFAESILIPPSLFDKENSNGMLNLVYGDARKTALHHDFLYRHNLHNIFRIPQHTNNLFGESLPAVPQSHQYSLLVNRIENGRDTLFVLFYTGSFTLMLCREGKLQVIQQFCFQTPEDIVFHLLNVCKSFDVLPDTLQLCLSGMVDKKSNLYAAIYKYFLHISFDEIPSGYTVAEELKTWPPHFFSNLFFQAVCV